MGRKRKILAVTGIRSEYDILYPIIDCLRKNDKFDLKLAVSGAHLTQWHGHTVDRIRKDGFNIIDTIHTLLMDNTGLQRAKGTGLLITGLSETVKRFNPDILLVVGDREESIAVAVVGTYMNTLIAHMGGGDAVYGNSDDPIRFAVSKLAHVHLVSSNVSALNLQKTGEEDFRIFNVGNPAFDNIRLTPQLSLKRISKFLGVDIEAKPYIVLIHHPLSSVYQDAGRQMEILLKGVSHFCRENGYQCIGIHPNTDPGALDILRVINTYDNDPQIRFFKTLPRDIFVNMMRHTKALIGNSSMGLLEAPYYQLPVVNVGDRQKGRLNAGNVVFVDYDPVLIIKALKRACADAEYRRKIKLLENPFGDGHSAQRIQKILASIDLEDKNWYIKRGVS